MEFVCKKHPECIKEQIDVFKTLHLGELVSIVKTFKLIEPQVLHKEYLYLLKERNKDKEGQVLNIMGKHYYLLDSLLNKMISFYCFYVSAELNNMDSMAFLGDFYFFGIYHNIAKDKAFSYYFKSIQPVIKPDHIHHRPSSMGFFQLGCLYNENTILPDIIREKKVFESFSNALYKCECDIPCQTERIFCVNPKYEKKYCYYLNFKKQKYCIETIFQLSKCYLNGIGVEKNLPKFLEYIEICSKFNHTPSIIYNAHYYFKYRHLNLQNAEKAFQLYFIALLNNTNNININIKLTLKSELFILKNIITIFEENQIILNKNPFVFINIYIKYLKFEDNITIKNKYFKKFKLTFIQNFELLTKVITIPFLLKIIIPECHQNQESSCFIVNTLMEKKFWSYKNRPIYPPSFNLKFNLVFLSAKRYQRENKIFIPIEIYLIIFEFLPFENWGYLPELMN